MKTSQNNGIPGAQTGMSFTKTDRKMSQLTAWFRYPVKEVLKSLGNATRFQPRAYVPVDPGVSANKIAISSMSWPDLLPVPTVCLSESNWVG